MAKILLVEDNEMNRDMLSRRLKKKGFDVVMAFDGQRGVEMASEESPDIILLDMSLPVMDGWDFLNNVRNTLKMEDIPAIALTSLDSEEAKQKTIENGFNFYEVKLNRERFLKTVDQALASKK